METKQRIEWLSEGLDGFIFPIVKEVLTYKQGEELCTKSEALSGIISTLKTQFDSQDWDRINAEKFNNKVQLKMEDWGVFICDGDNLVFINGEYICSINYAGDCFLSVQEKDNNILYVKSWANTGEYILKLFRPELERVTNEFNNR